VRLSASEEVSARNYSKEIDTIAKAIHLCSLYAYDGEGPFPFWFEENRDKFRKLCDITADLSDQCTTQSILWVDGVQLWVLCFSIELTLGSTEIEARVKWKHNGKTKYSEAHVVYI